MPTNIFTDVQQFGYWSATSLFGFESTHAWAVSTAIGAAAGGLVGVGNNTKTGGVLFGWTIERLTWEEGQIKTNINDRGMSVALS